MNAEFKRIARRDKKAFLSNQCKEIEENNRMGKTRDLFKKIRDNKVTFHAKMGSVKDRNVMDLTEAEDIKKRWQEYTEELYKKDLHDPDNHNGVITYLEPDILECEVNIPSLLSLPPFPPSPPSRSSQRVGQIEKVAMTYVHYHCKIDSGKLVYNTESLAWHSMRFLFNMVKVF